MKGFSYITYSKFFFFFKFNLAIFLFALNSTLCIKSFFSCIFILLEFQPEFFYSLIINSLIAFLIILPLKKKITGVINKQKDLLLLEMLPCGGLVSLFKMHSNNMQEFQIILKDIPRVRELINQDKIFIENKNNNWEERCNVLREAHTMEVALQQSALKDSWVSLVKETSSSWNMKDSSGNASSIYNLFVENQVFNGAQSFFLHRNLSLSFLHKNIPAHFRLQLRYKDSTGKLRQLTPDCVALRTNTINLNSENIYDFKSRYFNFTGKSPLRLYQHRGSNHIDYNLIHYGITSHETLTKYILATEESYVQPNTLIYCPKLDSILEAQIQISPTTNTLTPGWYNFMTGSFKSFKDIVSP
jgi:hypothetical protein